jgi:hypothetical protein
VDGQPWVTAAYLDPPAGREGGEGPPDQQVAAGVEAQSLKVDSRAQ